MRPPGIPEIKAEKPVPTMKETPQFGGHLDSSPVMDLKPQAVALLNVSPEGIKENKSSSSSSSSDEEKDSVPALGLTGALPNQDLFEDAFLS